MLSVFAVTVEPVGRPMEVTGHVSHRVVFGEQGELVLDDDDEHISLYHHDGIQYSLASKTPRPDGVEFLCNKAISSSAVHVQGRFTPAVTHELHRGDLHHLGELRHEGALIGVLYPNTLAYQQRRGWDDYIIILHQPHGEITLQPPRRRGWNQWLSVCCAGDHIVVVERLTQSMDVFKNSGNCCSVRVLTLICNR